MRYFCDSHHRDKISLARTSIGGTAGKTRAGSVDLSRRRWSSSLIPLVGRGAPLLRPGGRLRRRPLGLPEPVDPRRQCDEKLPYLRPGRLIGQSPRLVELLLRKRDHNLRTLHRVGIKKNKRLTQVVLGAGPSQHTDGRAHNGNGFPSEGARAVWPGCRIRRSNEASPFPQFILTRHKKGLLLRCYNIIFFTIRKSVIIHLRLTHTSGFRAVFL